MGAHGVHMGHGFSFHMGVPGMRRGGRHMPHPFSGGRGMSGHGV